MKKISLILVLLFVALTGFGQIVIDPEGDKPAFKDRLYFGGGFSATFGTITSVYLSPAVGYMITGGLSGGVGITYQYYKDNRDYNYASYESHSYGYRLFLRQNLYFIPKLPLFAYGEFENLNIEAWQYNSITEEWYLERKWYPRTMLGLGLFAPFGRRGGFFFAVLYDVMYSGSSSPYGSAWVYRVGFSL